MKKHLKKLGLAPGVITFTGDQKIDQIELNYVEYNDTNINETSVSKDFISNFHKPKKSLVQWYDIRGLHDIHLIDDLGNLFNIHSLVLEDIADTHQRPKYEEYSNGILFVLKYLQFDKESRKILTEQVSLYFSEGFLLSFQEDSGDLFAQVRKRLHITNSRLWKKNTDFLAYAILDLIVDNYYSVLDEIEDTIEALEGEVLNKANEHTKGNIHQLKQEMLTVRKAVIPLREAINRFTKTESILLEENTGLFLRDLYNNIVQITDTVDTYRDMLSGLQDLYLSEISFRMNNVMQVLAIITTIFVPLSFLAGLYGMNFDNIPELHVKHGYFYLVAFMVLVTFFQILFFRKKNWI